MSNHKEDDAVNHKEEREISIQARCFVVVIEKVGEARWMGDISPYSQSRSYFFHFVGNKGAISHRTTRTSKEMAILHIESQKMYYGIVT